MEFKCKCVCLMRNEIFLIFKQTIFEEKKPNPQWIEYSKISSNINEFEGHEQEHFEICLWILNSYHAYQTYFHMNTNELAASTQTHML